MIVDCMDEGMSSARKTPIAGMKAPQAASKPQKAISTSVKDGG